VIEVASMLLIIVAMQTKLGMAETHTLLPGLTKSTKTRELTNLNYSS
jgi:hypothetical protein